MALPDRRPPTPQRAEGLPRPDTLNGIRLYKDVPVTTGEVRDAQDYLSRAPRSQMLHQDLGDSAFIHIAVHDTVFSTDRPSHALGGVRVARDGPKLAPELSADMETKFLALHEMFEQGNAPETVREAARHDGGKAVLWADDPGALQGDRRTRVMTNIGHYVRDLNGLYVPGADMGTNGDDMVVISQAAGKDVDVSCKTGEIPNSEITAVGTFHAINALLDHKRETDPKRWDRDDLTMTFQGLGNVGRPLLLDLLRTYPQMRFNLFETNPEQVMKTEEMLRKSGISQEEIGGRLSIAVHPEDPEQLAAALKESDGFIPNAGAGVVNRDTLFHMPEGSIYVGAANDIIPKVGYADDPDVLDFALRKGITGVAAYQANCGGIAAIAVEDAGGTRQDAEQYMRGVYPLVRSTLAEAQRKGITPEEVAADRASQHFARYVKANNIAL